MKSKKIKKFKVGHKWGHVSIFVLLIVCCLSLYTQEKSPVIKVGDAAPPFSMEKLLQAPDNFDGKLESLRGKVVVLEFWATWCGPCREATPHLNELVEKYRQKSVQFISITDEEEWQVKKYLKYVTAISGWIGLDTDGSMNKAYGISYIPRTILIDQEGKIAAITYPLSVDSQSLDKLLARETLQPPQKKVLPETSKEVEPKEEIEQALVELVIRPSKPSISMSLSQNRFRARGMTLHKVVSIAYDISFTRAKGVTPLANNTYEVSVQIPHDDRNALLSLLQKSLKTAFGLKVHKETREMDVLILTAPKDKKLLLRPAAKEMHIRADTYLINSQGTTLPFFCNALENELQKIVMDETHLKGLYEFDLYWNPDNPNSVISAVQEQLGLVLKTERRTIEVLVFETEEK